MKKFDLDQAAGDDYIKKLTTGSTYTAARKKSNIYHDTSSDSSDFYGCKKKKAMYQNKI